MQLHHTQIYLSCSAGWQWQRFIDWDNQCDPHLHLNFSHCICHFPCQKHVAKQSQNSTENLLFFVVDVNKVSFPQVALLWKICSLFCHLEVVSIWWSWKAPRWKKLLSTVCTGTGKEQESCCRLEVRCLPSSSWFSKTADPSAGLACVTPGRHLRCLLKNGKQAGNVSELRASRVPANWHYLSWICFCWAMGAPTAHRQRRFSQLFQ